MKRKLFYERPTYDLILADEFDVLTESALIVDQEDDELPIVPIA